MFKYFKVCWKYMLCVPISAYVSLSYYMYCIMNIKLMTICVACIHVRMTFHNFLLLLDVLCGVTFSLQRRLETSVDNKFYYLWASVLVFGMFCKCYFTQ